GEVARQHDPEPVECERSDAGDGGGVAARHRAFAMRAGGTLLLFCVAIAPAQYSQRVWQSTDGLPEDFAQALAQTHDGYLWIGTSGGLVRFDGTRFRVFHRENESAFRDDSVYSLLVARDRTLWIGSEGGGLIRYREGKFRAFGAKEGLTNRF